MLKKIKSRRITQIIFKIAEKKLCFSTPSAICGYPTNDKSHFVSMSLSRNHLHHSLTLSTSHLFLTHPPHNNLSQSFQSMVTPCAQVITQSVGTPRLTNTPKTKTTKEKTSLGIAFHSL